MPLFYFHICNGYGFTEDHEGQQLTDESAARTQAIKEARAVMANDLRDGTLDLSSFIEVEDEKRQLLFTLVFEEAVRLTKGTASEIRERRRPTRS